LSLINKICIHIIFIIFPCVVYSEAPLRLNDFIKIESAAGILPAIVRQNANVRAQPSSDSLKLGLLEGGSTISAEFLLDSEWAKISYKSQDGYVHTSALIRQLYRADIEHSTADGMSGVFSMSGWHYPYLPGSYFINYHNNKYGHAAYGPLNGSGYDSIESNLYKLKYTKRNVYFTTAHSSGNRVYYSPYLIIPNEKELVVYELPAFTQVEENRIDLKGEKLFLTVRSYENCCVYVNYDIEVDLQSLEYLANGYRYDTDANNGVKEAVPVSVNIKRLPLQNSAI
jgi:hypothetical protein